MKKLLGMGRAMWAVVFMMMVSVSSFAQEATSLISVDNTKTGVDAITFTPSYLSTPILSAIVAIVAAVCGIWLAVIGIKWIKSFMHGK